jgi:hypothetical protein
VLEIVAGILLGPAVLHLVKPDQAVRLLSTIGLAFCSSSLVWSSTSATFAGLAPAWPDWRSA